MSDGVLKSSGSLTLDDVMKGIQLLCDQPHQDYLDNLSKLHPSTLKMLGYPESLIKVIYERSKP